MICKFNHASFSVEEPSFIPFTKRTVNEDREETFVDMLMELCEKEEVLKQKLMEALKLEKEETKIVDEPCGDDCGCHEENSEKPMEVSNNEN